MNRQARILTVTLVCASAACRGAADEGSTAATLHVPETYASVQSAIDAANAGDTVLVSAGTYRERIRLAAGVTVRSVGNDARGELGLARAETTVLDGGGSNGKEPGVTMADDSVLDGFTVTNVGRYDDERWQKHFETSGDNQPHEHIGAPGITGISVEGRTCTVTNNIVHHNGDTGIGILGIEGRVSQPRVSNNICYRNMGGGIGCMKKATGLITDNLCFENFYAGIGHNNASPIVQDNVCRGNIRAGIGISEGSCPIVRGNRCFANRRAGIGSRDGSATRPLIEDNDCFENGMAGIGAEEHAAPTIRGNRCYRNKLAGIGSRRQAHPFIVDNECYENNAAGIGQESDAVTTLINNHCHHNKAAGLGFAACDNGRSLVIGNRIQENAKVAAGVQGGWTVTFSRNELSRKGGLPPIVMVFEGARVTLSDNVIRGEGVAGVRVAGQVRLVRNQFEGLTLRKTGPPNFAVWGLEGSAVTMTENRISNWRHAVHATKSTLQINRSRVERFHGKAFVVREPARPYSITNCTVYSDDPKAVIVDASGSQGLTNGNQLKVRPNDSAGSANE